MQDFAKELIEEIEQYLAAHPIVAYFVFKFFDITIPRLGKSLKRLSVKIWKQFLIYIKKI